MKYLIGPQILFLGFLGFSMKLFVLCPSLKTKQNKK